MKIAVCMYGLLRTFSTTAKSQIKHLLAVNEADVYIYAPRNAGVSVIPRNQDVNAYKITHKKEESHGDVSGVVVTEDDLYSIYGNYLKKVVLYDYDSNKFDEMTQGLSGNGINEPSRVYSMIYHISQSARLAMASGIKYDAIVLCRPDLAFYSDINISDLEMAGKVHIPLGGGELHDGSIRPPVYYADYYKNVYLGELIQAGKEIFTDQMMIMEGKSLEIIADLFNELDSLVKQGVPVHPETMLYYALVYRPKRVVVTHDDWLYEIFRSNFKPIENGIMLIPKTVDNKKAVLRERIKQKLRSIYFKISPQYKKLCEIKVALDVLINVVVRK